MKNILKSIFDFIINFFKKFGFKDWLLFISIIGMIILYMLYNHAQNQLLYNKNSYADTLTVYKNKLGEAYTAKNTYVQTIKDLKKTNTELYDEVKSLRDNPIIVTKIKTEYIKKILVIAVPIMLSNLISDLQMMIDRTIIRALLALPEEDTVFFRQDIPGDIWKSIIQSMYQEKKR